MYTPFTKEAGRSPEYSFSFIYGIEDITRFPHQDMKFGGHIFWNGYRYYINIKTVKKKKPVTPSTGCAFPSNFRDFPTTTASTTTAATIRFLRTAWGHVLQPQGIKSNQSCARASCPAVRHRSRISQTSSHHTVYPHPKNTSSPSIKKNLQWSWLI